MLKRLLHLISDAAQYVLYCALTQDDRLIHSIEQTYGARVTAFKRDPLGISFRYCPTEPPRGRTFMNWKEFRQAQELAR